MYHKLIRIVAFVMVLVLALSIISTALAYKTIPYGSESEEVKEMQTKLRSKGYYHGKLDGKFGPATRKAVRKFQTAMGLRADGKPGERTLTALYEGKEAINDTRDKARNDRARQTKNPNTLAYGAEGDKVKKLQRRLRGLGIYKGVVDGVYGDSTYDAVKKFQYQKKLHADGIAGPKTLMALYGK